MNNNLISALKFHYKIDAFFRELTEALLENPIADDDIIALSLPYFREILDADLIILFENAENAIEIKGSIISKDTLSFHKQNDLKKQLKENEKILGVIDTGNMYCDSIIINSEEYKQCVVYPIKLSSDISGALGVFGKETLPESLNMIDPISHLSLLLVFQNRVKNLEDKAIEKSFTTTQRRLDEITRLHDDIQVICSKVGAFYDPEGDKDLLNNPFDHVVHRVFDAELGIIWEKNINSQWVPVPKISYDEKDRTNVDLLAEVLKNQSEESFVEKISKSTRSNNCRYPSRVTEYSETIISGFKVESMLGVPIFVSPENIKVIMLYNNKKKKLFSDKEIPVNFTRQDQNMLGSLSNLLSLSFKFDKRLDEELSNISGGSE